MDAFRSWAFTVCAAALLVSILEGAAPLKRGRSVIKFAAGLYIIAVLAAPLAGMLAPGEPAGTGFYNDISSASAQARLSAANAVEEGFAANARAVITLCLVQAGAPDPVVLVDTGRTQEGEVYLERVYVTAESLPDTAVQELRQCLGEAVCLFINGEEK